MSDDELDERLWSKPGVSMGAIRQGDFRAVKLSFSKLGFVRELEEVWELVKANY